MSFQGFEEEDFDVFAVEGLDERMEALKKTIRPKLEALGVSFKDYFTQAAGEEMFYHVAKHARRKVNPPEDTWVAFCNSKRGYKKLPHFQIGLFGSHLFVWFAVIYESPIKEFLGQELKEDMKEIQNQIPADFEWSVDHTKPATIPNKDLSEKDLEKLFDRLITVKKAELLCGITIDSSDPLLQDGDALISRIEDTFSTLLPLYQKSVNLYEQKA